MRMDVFGQRAGEYARFLRRQVFSFERGDGELRGAGVVKLCVCVCAVFVAQK